MKFILALDNIRSAHNVGSLLRTAWGFNLDSVVSIGVTPHMRQPDERRLPHVIARAEREITKTALGGEVLLANHFASSAQFLSWVDENKYTLISLEKTAGSSALSAYEAGGDTVLVVGNERDGVDTDILSASDAVLDIPIAAHKESYNVSIAGGIAMHELHKQFATLEP